MGFSKFFPFSLQGPILTMLTRLSNQKHLDPQFYKVKWGLYGAYMGYSKSFFPFALKGPIFTMLTLMCN